MRTSPQTVAATMPRDIESTAPVLDEPSEQAFFLSMHAESRSRTHLARVHRRPQPEHARRPCSTS